MFTKEHRLKIAMAELPNFFQDQPPERSGLARLSLNVDIGIRKSYRRQRDRCCRWLADNDMGNRHRSFSIGR